jgi:hypothetical protein
MIFVSPNQYSKLQDNLLELRKEVCKETVVQNVIISSQFMLLHYCFSLQGFDSNLHAALLSEHVYLKLCHNSFRIQKGPYIEKQKIA